MSNDDPTKPKGVRHVEKRRTSTCAFADRIAKISLDRYHQTVPESMRPNPTCLATIVTHDSRDDKLEVLSMGVGTKFLKESTLQEEVRGECYGHLVRDAHAEVLARRSFRREITIRLLRTLLDEDDNNKQSIFYRSNDGKFTIQPEITFHMYTSSAPCGNATLKKFAKMTKEKFREDLGPNEWPTTDHPPIQGHSIRLGQFALLVKKDNSISNNKEGGDDSAQKSSKDLPKGKSWPANESGDWAPPGTSIVGMDKGSIHTCSDKICRWNCTGLQGSLLASLLEAPLYLSSLTVGRKLTECICRRAVCCRINNLRLPGASSVYRINHPAIMGTAVYMDESGVVETNEETLGQDVRFHSSLTWTWWSSIETEGYSDPDESDGEHIFFECINGITGLLERDSKPSKISTYSLLQLFLRVYNLANNSDESIDNPMSLTDLMCIKRKLSPNHEEMKEAILTKHRVLKQWKRRSHMLNK